MASGFFALFDDIATLMDDVATMTKVAAKKTSGILGDDLAVNAEKASGFVPDRELPVLWAISKGSFINKIIILPVAFLLSAFAPVAVTVILVLGGLYLAYEGAEKILEWFIPHHQAHEKINIEEEVSPEQVLAHEKKKIKSAITTDFILSVEIVIIALGTVVEQPLSTQILVVSIIALLATVGVYGLVAVIVRMDEFGYKLIALNPEENTFSDKIGRLLVKGLPVLIRIISFVGTIALLLVAGGIFSHNIEFFHHLLETWPGIIKEFLIGLAVGIVVLIPILIFKKIAGKKTA